MVEHTGKKRRKEVQLACVARRELRAQMLVTLALFVLLCMCVVAVGALVACDLVPLDRGAAQVFFFAVVAFAVLCLAMRFVSWSKMREEHRQHCARFNITPEEMDALRDERGQGHV